MNEESNDAGVVALRARVAELSARLLESDARRQAILDAVLDAVITIDCRGTIQTFNAPASRLFGYAPSEMIGQNVGRLMPEPYRSTRLPLAYSRDVGETGKLRVFGGFVSLN